MNKLLPREKIIKEGPKGLEDSELIAIMLGTGTKEENVFELSKRISNEIGIENLIDMNFNELKNIKGIGAAKATKLLACFEIAKRYVVKKKELAINFLLSTSQAYEYVKNGKVDGIRISTRPDYIDRKTLKRLKKYKVKTIELGVQSTNDYILKKCKRGHTYKDVVKASRMIRFYRFRLGHQMMVGLPESNEIDDLNTAKDLIKLK